ncbi:similar to Saccharomyces cerevisiae YKL213C DOA1 WD repeat protein required for ubiquitin-mediated protein degradation [Maudiozyma saulgeensis]|uniref:Similar to Saccharomyces cerevisiae YKL213C DOA1 WD repeat protein required for ubiquitin-mediated protein degradation n=1 Tax=Maudiozyma saulgeensis TaxID=1789683 RepID=A0A1X7R1A3_9SACH|nr:similar to Saccharomyces cerevisiae YKL213C DOA1 WD repeat protein required for ubiquitin-mediated protein degradation [Kazachstania saulgeensis]
MFQLSATLKAHDQDVKGVVAINNDKLASVSRDGTVRLWSISDNKDNLWTNEILYNTDMFLNSITYDSVNEIIYFAGKDSLINGCKIDSSLTKDPQFTLVGHSSNVCSLNENIETTELISGSWDNSAIVWSNGSKKYSLKGHEAAVWDAKFLPNSKDKFVTVSADKTIKIWNKETTIQTIAGIHEDVIRQIDFIPSSQNDFLFATCSNDTTIKLFNENGKIINSLQGHESFVYDIKYNRATSELISCGEDRSLRIWDTTTGKAKQVIRLPAISIWCLDILPNNDIVVGCSDNTIRIFSTEKNRFASPNALEEFQKEVENTSLSSQSMEFDESKLSPSDVLKTPGNKEGQVVVVKSPSGSLEAYQYSNSNWSKVGEVVSSNSAGSDKKVNFEGKDYDYVFDVDVEEGQPPLKLPINIRDNPYEAADKFIIRYDLPSNYKDQIVNFILQNTNGISFDQPNSSSKQEATKNVPPMINTDNMKVLPVNEFLSLDSFNPDALLNGIVKLNEKEKTFNDEDCATIGSALYDIEGNIQVLYNYAVTIKSSWTTKTPAYDIIRLIVHKLENADDISEFIEEGLDSKEINIKMLTTRILANCFLNQKWGIELMGSVKMYDSVFETMDNVFENETKRQAQNLALAVSTLVLNYSVLVVKDPVNKIDMVPIVSDAINTKFGKLEEYQESEEAAYRLVIAYGNLSLVEPSLKQFAKSIKWLSEVNSRYSPHNERFSNIFKDIY